MKEIHYVDNDGIRKVVRMSIKQSDRDLMFDGKVYRMLLKKLNAKYIVSIKEVGKKSEKG